MSTELLPGAVVEPVVRWYRRSGRDLPWREPGTTPWQVLVSEVMLAQTPVARVEPAYRQWISLWPDAPTTAAASRADLLRAWGRLGYPRRALRLHETAGVVTRDYGGVLPVTEPELRALPGVGEYTAAAVLAFAHGQRIAVLDTNVRRVLARALTAAPRAPLTLTNAERERARSLLPSRHSAAAEWSVAVMELGALICTAKAPRCSECPLVDRCAWVAVGKPVDDSPPPRGQAWHGTDRQCRGRIMAALRASPQALSSDDVARVWDDDGQRERCLAGLLDDGLVVRAGRAHYALPT